MAAVTVTGRAGPRPAWERDSWPGRRVEASLRALRRASGGRRRPADWVARSAACRLGGEGGICATAAARRGAAEARSGRGGLCGAWSFVSRGQAARTAAPDCAGLCRTVRACVCIIKNLWPVTARDFMGVETTRI